MDVDRVALTADRSLPASGVIEGMYDAHADAVYLYIARRVGPDLGRDLLADVFRVAIEQYGRFDASRGTHRSWLFGIATNLIRRHWRTEARRMTATARLGGQLPFDGDPLLRVDDRMEATRRALVLVDAIGRLDPEDRDLLVLVAWENCTRAEIADILRIPVGTVRSRLNRIRAVLRHSIQGATDDE